MKVLTRGFSAAVIALSSALGLSLAGAHRSIAAPQTPSDNGPHLRLLSPAARADFQGAKPIEIDALYEGTPGNGIVSLDLYIDGVKAQSQALASPEAKGIVSFLVDSSLLSPGTHYVVVRATAADAEVRSVRGSFIYQEDGGSDNSAPSSDPNALEWPSAPGARPQMRLLFPQPNETVQGKVTIQVDASDVDGKPPYVSIFVDGEMRQLVNYRPFEYEWDTNPIPNGWHTIAIVEAFDDDSVPVAHLNPVKVYVNNPGGETQIRTDLQDGVKTVKPVFTQPVAPAPKAHLTRPATQAHKARTPQAHKTPAAPLAALPSLPLIPRVSLAPVMPLSSIAPPPVTHKMATRKTASQRPGARRPLGQALLAAPASVNDFSAGHPALIAELDPRWDGPADSLLPALSDPAIVALPAPAAHPKSQPAPTSSVKSWKRPVSNPASHQALPPTGFPLIAATPLGKHANPVPQSLRAPVLMAQGGPLDDSPSLMLSLPSLPETPAPVAVAVPRPAPKATVRAAMTPPAAPKLHLNIHVPTVIVHAPRIVKPHVAAGGALLLRAVGEQQVQFNQAALPLERPLAARQNILFGPLRRIFEYGGGTLQWDARSGTVRAQTSRKDIRLTIGNRNAVVNNQPFALNAAPYLSAGRTMIPLSFVGVAMDADVQYDPATGHLKITSRH